MAEVGVRFVPLVWFMYMEAQADLLEKGIMPARVMERQHASVGPKLMPQPAIMS